MEIIKDRDVEIQKYLHADYLQFEKWCLEVGANSIYKALYSAAILKVLHRQIEGTMSQGKIDTTLSTLFLSLGRSAINKVKSAGFDSSKHTPVVFEKYQKDEQAQAALFTINVYRQGRKAGERGKLIASIEVSLADIEKAYLFHDERVSNPSTEKKVVAEKERELKEEFISVKPKTDDKQTFNSLVEKILTEWALLPKGLQTILTANGLTFEDFLPKLRDDKDVQFMFSQANQFSSFVSALEIANYAASHQIENLKKGYYDDVIETKKVFQSARGEQVVTVSKTHHLTRIRNSELILSRSNAIQIITQMLDKFIEHGGNSHSEFTYDEFRQYIDENRKEFFKGEE